MWSVTCETNESKTPKALRKFVPTAERHFYHRYLAKSNRLATGNLLLSELAQFGYLTFVSSFSLSVLILLAFSSCSFFSVHFGSSRSLSRNDLAFVPTSICLTWLLFSLSFSAILSESSADDDKPLLAWKRRHIIELTLTSYINLKLYAKASVNASAYRRQHTSPNI